MFYSKLLAITLLSYQNGKGAKNFQFNLNYEL